MCIYPIFGISNMHSIHMYSLFQAIGFVRYVRATVTVSCSGFRWGRRPRVPSLIFAKNIRLRERPGRRQGEIKKETSFLPFFLICFQWKPACFNGNNWDCDVESVTYFSASYLCGVDVWCLSWKPLTIWGPPEFTRIGQALVKNWRT